MLNCNMTKSLTIWQGSSVHNDNKIINICKTIINNRTMHLSAQFEDTDLRVPPHYKKNRLFLKYKHDCEFAYDLDIVAKYFPGMDPRSRLKRYFIRMRLISEVHKIGNYWLRSQGTVAMEKQRHILNYPYIIHPFSDARKYWEIFMILIFSVQFLMIPIDIAYFRAQVRNFKLGNHWKTTRFVFDVICCFDVVICFFTGYYNEAKKTVVLEPSTIALNYLRGYFVPDAVSSFPTHFDIFLDGDMDGTVSVVLQITSALKMFRLITYQRYLYNCAEIYNINTTIVKALMIFIVMALYFHVVCCCFLFVHSLETSIDEPTETREAESLTRMAKYTATQLYIRTMYRTCMVITNAGYGPAPPSDVTWYVALILFWLSSRVFYIFFIAKLSEIVKGKTSAHHKYVEMVKQLREYMRHKKFPEYMQRRLVTYYEFRFQKSYFRESEILATISGQLRQEVILHSCRKLVENVAFFKNLPLALIVRIVSSLRSEVFLVNDVIVKANTPGNSMFFIATGTVAVFTNSGREICHLEDGAHFGEIALVMRDEMRVASVIAVEVCELYKLERTDFVKAIHPYPDLLDNIQRIAADRMEKATMLDEHNRKEMAAKRLY